MGKNEGKEGEKEGEHINISPLGEIGKLIKFKTWRFRLTGSSPVVGKGYLEKRIRKVNKIILEIIIYGDI